MLFLPAIWGEEEEGRLLEQSVLLPHRYKGGPSRLCYFQSVPFCGKSLRVAGGDFPAGKQPLRSPGTRDSGSAYMEADVRIYKTPENGRADHLQIKRGKIRVNCGENKNLLTI